MRGEARKRRVEELYRQDKEAALGEEALLPGKGHFQPWLLRPQHRKGLPPLHPYLSDLGRAFACKQRGSMYRWVGMPRGKSGGCSKGLFFGVGVWGGGGGAIGALVFLL